MAKRIVIYGSGIFFSKILVFFMIPVYARVFRAADYGYYDVVIQNMQMLVSVSFIEIWSGILRFLFLNEDKSLPVNTFIRMMPVLMPVYLAAFFLLSFFMDIKYPVLMLVYGIAYLFFSVSNSICRGYGKDECYVIAGMISTVVSCGLSIIFAVQWKKGIDYLIIAQCIGYFISIFYVEMKTKCYYTAIWKSRKQMQVREMTAYCFPLMLNSFSFLFLDTYNKNILLRSCGEVVSGYYAYVSKYSAVLSILISIYSLAWQEQAFLTFADKNRDSMYSFYINSFFRIMGLGIPVFTVVLYWVSPIVGGKQYADVTQYIPLAVFGAFTAGVSGLFSTMIAVNGKTNYILLSTVAGVAVNVTLASRFIGKFGINASSAALCAGFGITAVLRLWFASTDIKIKIDYKIFIMFLAEALTVVFAFQIQNRMVMAALLAVFTFLWFAWNKHMVLDSIRFINHIWKKRTR